MPMNFTEARTCEATWKAWAPGQRAVLRSENELFLMAGLGMLAASLLHVSAIAYLSRQIYLEIQAQRSTTNQQGEVRNPLEKFGTWLFWLYESESARPPLGCWRLHQQKRQVFRGIFLCLSKDIKTKKDQKDGSRMSLAQCLFLRSDPNNYLAGCSVAASPLTKLLQLS